MLRLAKRDVTRDYVGLLNVWTQRDSKYVPRDGDCAVLESCDSRLCLAS